MLVTYRINIDFEIKFLLLLSFIFHVKYKNQHLFFKLVKTILFLLKKTLKHRLLCTFHKKYKTEIANK